MVSPSASSSGGNTSRPTAATSSGTGICLAITPPPREAREALADQAARPKQHPENHQKKDRRGRGSEIADADHHALADADQQRGEPHAPERPEPADHHDDEGGRDDLLPHR